MQHPTTEPTADAEPATVPETFARKSGGFLVIVDDTGSLAWDGVFDTEQEAITYVEDDLEVSRGCTEVFIVPITAFYQRG